MRKVAGVKQLEEKFEYRMSNIEIQNKFKMQMSEIQNEELLEQVPLRFKPWDFDI